MIDPTSYDNADFIPDGHSYFNRWAAAAKGFRDALPSERQKLDRPYGEDEREVFDLFLPPTTPVGLFVFLHGGFWRLSSCKDWSHLGAGMLAHGWAVAIPSYPLAPAARISRITQSVTRSLPVMAAEVSGPILISGHSAGGHLAMRMVCPDVALQGELRARIAGILPISPLGDLAPLIPLPMNDALRIDAEEAERESPINYPAPSCKVEIEVGAIERPSFVDQATRMAATWPNASLTIAEGCHHFDVIDPLAEAGSPMVGRLLAMSKTG